MPYFNIVEETLMQRVGFLKSMVGESELHSGPCTLLDSQLNRLAVLTDELSDAIRKARAELAKRKD